MTNVAYTEEYAEYRREQEGVFCDECLRGEEISGVAFGVAWRRCFYSGMVGPYMRHGTVNELMDQSNAVLYSWRNLDDSAEFCRVIDHSDGNSYVIFRTELYGYSVLCLSTLKVFHFIPSGSFPRGETFIWTDVCYNKENDLMVVSGCYWACPFGMLIVDFSEPMKEPGVWADVHEHLEEGYDRFDDIEFVEWCGMDLIFNALNNQTEMMEMMTLSEGQYRGWLE